MNLNKELEDKGEESNAEQSGDLSFSSCCLDAQNGQHVINQSSLEVYSERVPDADSMKMFVGQIPKDWTEEDCRQLLETYGAIHTLNILRDKETKKSKGCCFVTYYTRKAALDAQNDLHNLKKLPTCRNPIQMKPADNENKNDRKLFVGKLPKFMNETDVLALFANYGAIEECLVLRDANGVSKGCAFVTFSMRSNAASAIRALHHNKTFEGSTSPIVVKFAESNGKETKKMVNETISPVLQSLYQSPGTFASCIGAPTLLDQSYLNLIKIQQQQHQQQQQQQQQQQNLQMLSLPAQAYISPEMAYTSSILFGGGLAKLTSQPPPPPPQLIPNQPILSATASHLNGKKMITTADHTALSLASLSTLAQAIPHSFASLPPLAKFNTATPSASIGTNLKQLEGPDGANLFIYHLPAEYNDTDLVSLFSSFGNVISAKVFIDKNSNLSKCFGFVSFDNADSAQAAIRSMNGFQVLNKRLKVQLKKVRDRPY